MRKSLKYFKEVTVYVQSYHNQPRVRQRRQVEIKCYDSELIEKIAEESGLARDYIADKGEYAAHSNWFANAFAASRSYSGMSTQDYLWTVQRKIILDLAEKESCVIVGRCADYILQDRNDCLRVFIHADMQKRAEAY